MPHIRYEMAAFGRIGRTLTAGIRLILLQCRYVKHVTDRQVGYGPDAVPQAAFSMLTFIAVRALTGPTSVTIASV